MIVHKLKFSIRVAFLLIIVYSKKKRCVDILIVYVHVVFCMSFKCN